MSADRIPPLAEMGTEEVGALGSGWWALLPIGATEAHGPHLPLATDVIIAEGVAAAAAQLLAAKGVTARVMPPIAYSVTDCAADFPGTVGVSRATARAVLFDLAASVVRSGARGLCLINAHLEPEHRHSLRDVVETPPAGGATVLFPDIVRGRFARRLGEEFMSGACHAGSYETSIVLALRPELVHMDRAAELPPNPVSLGQALAEGKKTFLEAGGPRAYFGDPAAASAQEGRQWVSVLAEIVVESIEQD